MLADLTPAEVYQLGQALIAFIVICGAFKLIRGAF